MADSNRARIDALFAAALELPAAQRSGFLDGACEGDAVLRGEVEELLRLTASPDSDFDDSVAAGGPLVEELLGELEGPAANGLVGQHLGPWLLVEEIDRGGMGEVFLAQRTAGGFEQRAALKIVQAGERSEEAVARFERERQILASLEHPNIARLIDGGRAGDGRPYLAMEYVVGRPIDRYCVEEGLDLDQRLELFVGVARAVQAAHRSLIVHLDLKPSNILVTENGTPKLLDFGIARLLEPAPGEAAPTRTLFRALSPEYASPEQVRGEPLTTASDVYQLGLLLFELLTGERAQSLDGAASPRDLEHAVCERPTPRPSTVVGAAEAAEPSAGRGIRPARALRGDLDNIVLRAVHKEPERRYGSVVELVADLERFRRGFPVEARPDTLWYRTSRFVLRHRVAVAAATLLVALLVGYAVTVTIQRRQIRAEAERARKATAFVSEVFRSPGDGELGTGRRSALDIIDEGADLAARKLDGQPQLQAEILTEFGQLLNQIGRYERAGQILERALALQLRLLPPSDPEIGDILMLLGMSLHYSGRLHEAELPLRRALAIFLDALGPSHPSTCNVRSHLGDLLHSRGDLAAAEAELESAHRMCGWQAALRDLANVLRDRGELDLALAAYATALDKYPPEDGMGRGLTLVYRGYALTLAGDLDEAARALEAAAVAGAPNWGEDHPVLGTRLRYLSRLALAQGDLDSAERHAEEALAMLRRWLGDDNHLVTRAFADRAAVALAQGRAMDAIEIASESIARYRELGIPDHPKALEVAQVLGAAQLELGRPEEALATLRDLLDRQQASYAAIDTRIAVSKGLLGAALVRLGRAEEARKLRSEVAGSLAPGSRRARLYRQIYRAAWESTRAEG